LRRRAEAPSAPRRDHHRARKQGDCEAVLNAAHRVLQRPRRRRATQITIGKWPKISRSIHDLFCIPYAILNVLSNSVSTPICADAAIACPCEERGRRRIHAKGHQKSRGEVQGHDHAYRAPKFVRGPLSGFTWRRNLVLLDRTRRRPAGAPTPSGTADIPARFRSTFLARDRRRARAVPRSIGGWAPISASVEAIS